ncbi:O-antigen ligase family protein [Congregibacter brevis]|uniref:O-antigen ligase family protein n=1 Tax=Congregibacter brevis TaxID=3081201 RepID=A0ABZ0IJ11_9GAMM|nr:O-antigen ligase family protein [Congregibacter sp. IMCC45268]
MLFYFPLVLLIDDKKKFKSLCLVLVGTCIYYTYWANERYLSGEMWAYTLNGRLRGPGVYRDENAFAVMFVCCLPFLFVVALELRSKWLRYGILLSAVPLGWHSVFLIASRGALLGLTLSSLAIGRMFRSKTMVLALGGLLILAVLTQGGVLLSRSTETVEVRAQEDRPLDPRLVTWKAGYLVMLDYPLLGVGAERFQLVGAAYLPPDTKRVQVIHNTFLQVASQSGIPAGLIYLWFFYRVFWKTRTLTDSKRFALWRYKYALDASLIGFFVCAIFLNLLINEFLYLLLGLNQILDNQTAQSKLNDDEKVGLRSVSPKVGVSP